MTHDLLSNKFVTILNFIQKNITLVVAQAKAGKSSEKHMSRLE